MADEPLAVAAHREMTPGIEREREQQHDPDPEGREAEPDQGDGPDHVIGRTVATRGGDHRQRYCDHHREQSSEPDQPERHRQPFENEPSRGDVVEE